MAGDTPATIIREMVRGQEGASKLRSWLREGRLGPDTAAVDRLMDVISGSFSRALSVLNSGTQSSEAAFGGGSGSLISSGHDWRSEAEYSGGKRKAHSDPDSLGGGCRRIRSQSSFSSWRSVTSNTLDDGQTWRKYGQKEIQNSKHPRSYFRCTHKHDQGCEATRQVQRSDGDPSSFLITYFGKHTCQDPSTIPHFIEAAAAAAADPPNSILISFGSPLTQPAASFPCSLVQQPACDEEVLSNNPTPGSSPAEGLVPAATVGPAKPPPQSEMGSGAFYSASPSRLDHLDFMAASSFDQFGGYENMFPLDYDGDFSASFG